MKDLNNLPVRVANMVKKLRTKGLTAEEKKILPTRLKALWIRPSTSDTSQSRSNIAREVVSSVQSESAHLCFVLILLLTATQFGNKKFYNTTIAPLLRTEGYNVYEFSLRPDDESFLKKMAEEEGFGEISGFVALMRALFPDNQSPAAERRM
jgi:hypothetical protein